MRRACLVAILLLAAPAWGQDTTAWTALKGARYPGPAYEWETVRVDSANLGSEHGLWVDVEWRNSLPQYNAVRDSTRWHGAPAASLQRWELGVHDWVYSEPYPSAGLLAAIAYAPMERERICRHCKRHEWQQQVEVPAPKSEFEQLKEKLR